MLLGGNLYGVKPGKMMLADVIVRKIKTINFN